MQLLSSKAFPQRFRCSAQLLLPAGPIVAAAVSGAQSLANTLPNNATDDVIGAFSVRLTNQNGQLQTAWVAIPGIEIRQGEKGEVTIKDNTSPFAVTQRAAGRETAVFVMKGTGGGAYRMAATVEMNPATLMSGLVYLGRASGACNRPQQVTLQGSLGNVEVTDEPTQVPVSSNTLHWSCASSGRLR